MKYTVEYRGYIYIDVEADCLEDAVDKADEERDKLCEQIPQIGYSELSYASWEDDEGKFHEEDFNY